MTRRGPRRPDTIYELRATVAAIEKLAARGISVEEAEELPRNNHVTLRNRGRARRSARKLRNRRLLIGETDGGRTLTLVIERTNDPTGWLIVTGWTATPSERRRIVED
jgi:hypothetical protein